jgi:hypothetical protein
VPAVPLLGVGVELEQPRPTSPKPSVVNNAILTVFMVQVLTRNGLRGISDSAPFLWVFLGILS